MRMISVVKILLLAAAVALPSVASAKTKLPPGACAFGKKGVIASGAVCSYNCDPKTMWCAQQLCVNGTLNQILPCLSPFCSPKCGG